MHAWNTAFMMSQAVRSRRENSREKKTEDASFQNSNFSTVLLLSIDETE